MKIVNNDKGHPYIKVNQLGRVHAAGMRYLFAIVILSGLLNIAILYVVLT